MSTAQYILNRLQEPGSMRSLALVLFTLKAMVPASWGWESISQDDIQNFLNVLILILGGVSFSIPEKTQSAEVLAANLQQLIQKEKSND